jgi:hypothetical protein
LTLELFRRCGIVCLSFYSYCTDHVYVVIYHFIPIVLTMFMLSFIILFLLYWPCLCCHLSFYSYCTDHVYVVIYFCDGMWSYFEWKRICFYRLLKYVLLLQIQLSRVDILLIDLTPPHCCACPRPEPGFPTSHVVVLCSMIWGEVIVCFVEYC